MFYAIVIAVIFGLVFLPSLWVKYIMRLHGKDRPDLPGTGGELAEHLLERAGLDHVKVETTPAGDHYDPIPAKTRHQNPRESQEASLQEANLS